MGVPFKGKFSPYDTEGNRMVPAFSISSRQRNTTVSPPPPCSAFKPRPPAHSTFRQSYDRGDFPIALKHDGRGNRISWKVYPLSPWTTTTTSPSSLTDSGKHSTLTSS